MTNSSKLAKSVVTLIPAILISLAPISVSLQQGQSQQFTAAVSATANQTVNWSLSPAVGTLSTTGRYTAPATVLTAQTVTVTARSAADPTNSASGVVSLQTTPVATQWSMGYYLGFETAFPVSAIQWNGLTHIIHVAALVNADGTLDLASDDISTTAEALVAAAHAHNVKVLLCLMAVGDNSTNFNLAITNHLSAFVANIMAAIYTYGYDGVDLDWEPPSPGFGANPTSAANMLTLAPALRTALGSKVLTAAANDLDGTYWSTAHTSFDRIATMSYNMCGTWNPYLWYTAPLFGYVGGSLDYFKTQWLDAGFPAAKLALGVPFSAWKWTGGVLSSDHAQGISGPLQAWQAGNAPTGTIVGYSTVASLITSGNYNWDNVAVVPYLSSPGTPSTSWYVTYESPQSIQAKVQYIIAQNLGGWIIWNLHWGYVSGGLYPHPLLDAVQVGSAPAILSASALSSGTVGTLYSTSLSTTGAMPVQWSLSSGRLPSGLSLSSTGLISGTPTTLGTSALVVTVRNFAGSASRSFTITIASSAN